MSNFFMLIGNFIRSFFVRKKMKPNEYVWYAGYGSNLYRERFHCYIVGGTAPGADDINSGCTDKTLPIQESADIIHHDLYFAKRSSKWQGGGLGLVRIKASQGIQTYCNMYLITKEQFVEVVRQENKNDNSINIDFNAALKNGSFNFKPGGTYGNLLHVGYKSNYPIFTFTSSVNEFPSRRPSERYLKMFMSGLLESHKLAKQQIIDYLISKDGIMNNYSLEQLAEVFESLDSS